MHSKSIVFFSMYTYLAVWPLNSLIHIAVSSYTTKCKLKLYDVIGHETRWTKWIPVEIGEEQQPKRTQSGSCWNRGRAAAEADAIGELLKSAEADASGEHSAAEADASGEHTAAEADASGKQQLKWTKRSLVPSPTPSFPQTGNSSHEADPAMQSGSWSGRNWGAAAVRCRITHAGERAGSSWASEATCNNYWSIRLVLPIIFSYK